MIYVMRDDWGARAPTGITPIGASEGIFVHYTVTATGPDEAAICRSVQAFHMGTKGWQDIAYSWMVGQSGRIYEGRGWGVAGGHTEGWNSRSHAVCWIGGDEQPTPAALSAIAAVCAEHARRYGGWVKPHRAVSSTSCPGDILTGWVAAGQPTTDQSGADIVTPDDIEAVAKRVTAYLANPQTNPGTIVDSGVRAAVAQIQTVVADPVGGIAARLAGLSPAQVAAAVPADIAKAVAAELAKRLVS